MAKIISTLDDYVSYLNTLYNSNSTPPTEGDEDYTIWTSLANISVNVWQSEEGVLWKELFAKLSDAPDGDKTTTTAYSYTCPALFQFPACSKVWIGSGINKRAFTVIPQEEKHLHENDNGDWCYFLMDGSPTLEFNPNCSLPSGLTINYEYYKYATKLTTGSSTFEMSDPMFSVYFALAELKKEEGNDNELQVASQKLEAMRVKNITPSWFQGSQFFTDEGDGFGQ